MRSFDVFFVVEAQKLLKRIEPDVAGRDMTLYPGALDVGDYRRHGTQMIITVTS